MLELSKITSLKRLSQRMSQAEEEHDHVEAEEDESENDSGTSQEGSDSESEEEIESLVRGRERRATAGNRLSTLLNQEGGEDEVDLLFNSTEDEDAEFEDDAIERPSDDDDDSSSSSSGDDGDGHAVNELDGEKQLQKEERAAKQAQKRKAEKSLFKAPPPRKKVRLAESPVQETLSTSVERKRKKSERVSWIPTDADAPVRTSTRALALENKQRTIASIKESAERRAKQIASMEAAQQRKIAAKSRPMTQEERLAEADRTERLNSKSLYRWEEMERDRLAKQKAHLDALHNRQMEGPAVRWYSGPATWVNGKVKDIGKRHKVIEMQEDVPDKNLHSTDDEHQAAPQNINPSQELLGKPAKKANSDTPSSNQPIEEGDQATQAATPGLLEGIDFYASLPSVPKSTKENESTHKEVNTAPPANTQAPETLNLPAQPVPLMPSGTMKPPQHEVITIPTAVEPPRIEQGSINILTLLNFDEVAYRSSDIQRRVILNQRNGMRPIRPNQPICAITALPARYRDPLTGLPYKNSQALRTIRSMVPGGAVRTANQLSHANQTKASPAWSNLLDAWVGTRKPARGVPEGFQEDKARVLQVKAES